MGQTQLLWALFTWAKGVFLHLYLLRVCLSWMTGWDLRSCCPEDDSHGLLLDGFCLEKGAEYIVMGGRTDGLFYCGTSYLAIVLNHFQPIQVSGPSSLDTAAICYIWYTAW